MSLHFCLFSGPGDPLSPLRRLLHCRPDRGDVRHLRRERADRHARHPAPVEDGGRQSCSSQVADADIIPRLPPTFDRA
jgi:hypothetical protein